MDKQEFLIRMRAASISSTQGLPKEISLFMAALQLFEEEKIDAEYFGKEQRRFVNYLVLQAKKPDGVNFIALDRVGV